MATGIRDASFKVLSDFIFAAQNKRPYLANTNFNKPSGSYITCKFLNADKTSTGGSKTQPVDDTGRVEVTEIYLIQYEIMSFRDNAYSVLFDLGHSFLEPDVRSVLSSGGLGYSYRDGPIDASMDINGITIEERAIMNVYLYGKYRRNAVRGTAPGTIEHIKTQGELDSYGEIIDTNTDSKYP